MRPFNLVVDAIINQIPKDLYRYGCNYTKLVNTLNEIKSNNDFTAPEAMGSNWELLDAYLNVFLGVNGSEWENTISKLCKGELDYTLYL